MTHDEHAAAPVRLRSLDAYRGFVMLLLATGGLGLIEVANTVDRDGEMTWVDHVANQFNHAEWRGCTLWDLIQPSFLFIVGVAMPFAYAARTARGESFGRQFRHALGRSAVLIALGVFLASAWSTRTNFTFTDVLAQIGLGYWIVFLLLYCPVWVQAIAIVLILVGDWALFAFYPLPPHHSNIFALGVPNNIEWNWGNRGFEMHWMKSVNVAGDFDRWFLNRFPRSERFVFNEGGYQTLNFVPSIATMLAGVLAGEWLRSSRSGRTKTVGLFLAGALCLIIANALDPVSIVSRAEQGQYQVLCPTVKRLWSPTWVVFSTAWTCWMLAAFHYLIDVRGWRRWSFPLVIVGMNSIVMYMMSQLMRPWLGDQIEIHLGTLFGWLHDHVGLHLNRELFATDWGPFHESLVVTAALWLICLWLYRRRIFVHI